MPRPLRHVFVCVNQRPVGAKPSCAGREPGQTESDGEAVFAALLRSVGQRSDLWGKVAVTGCGCLGPCWQGPNVVVYPDAVWYAGVSPADADEIVDRHLGAGQPVARLVYTFPVDDEDQED